jgi:DnaJ homolog subfamily C member 28
MTMTSWQLLIDQMIQESIGDGDVSHLPGAGKPLNLDDDLYTPKNMQVTFKIMKDNNIAPDWMATSKSLEKAEQKLLKQIEIRASRYQIELRQALRNGTILKEIEIEDSWKAYIADFAERVDRYNKQVLTYNLSAPKQIPHKQILVSEKLITTALQQTKGDI